MVQKLAEQLATLGSELEAFRDVPGVVEWLALPEFTKMPPIDQATMRYYLGKDQPGAQTIIEQQFAKKPPAMWSKLLPVALELIPQSESVNKIALHFSDNPDDAIIPWIIAIKQGQKPDRFPMQSYQRLLIRSDALSLIQALGDLGPGAHPFLQRLRNPQLLGAVSGESHIQAALALLGALDRLEWERRKLPTRQ